MARKISFDLPTTTPAVNADAPSVPTTAPVSRPLLNTSRATGALGAISRSLEGLTDRAKRADEIEHKLTQGASVVELDTSLIDGAAIPDRMAQSAEQQAAFREIIREHGQQTPILVRAHPHVNNRFQVAFGHRRLGACGELGIPVKAVIRALSDAQMVVAQGQENSARTDLSYIEKARFAARLEDNGYAREVIMQALTIDKGNLSNLVAIATRIPVAIIDAIGAAPDFGRLRWSELAELVEQPEGRKKATVIVEDAEFAKLDSNQRFAKLYDGLRVKMERQRPESWNAKDGTRGAQIQRNGSKLSLVFDDRVAPAFGQFVQSRLQELYDDYKKRTA